MKGRKEKQINHVLLSDLNNVLAEKQRRKNPSRGRCTILCVPNIVVNNNNNRNTSKREREIQLVVKD